MLNTMKKKNVISIHLKKKLMIITLIFFAFMLTGYTFPPNQPYLIVSDSFGSNTYLFFPRDRVQYLSIVDSNKIISSYSSTVYGYTTQYRINFPTYSDEYTYSSGYQSYNYTIREIKENHLYSDDEFNIESHSTIIYISLIGGVLLCLLVLSVKS